MTSEDTIQTIISSAKKTDKNILIIFSGENCKWCARLKEVLKDNKLQNYCKERSIEFSWVTLDSKAHEEAEACKDGACKITTRNKFGIKTIPTAVLMESSGSIIASTEYLDTVDSVGGEAYIKWIEENLLF